MSVASIKPSVSRANENKSEDGSSAILDEIQYDPIEQEKPASKRRTTATDQQQNEASWVVSNGTGEVLLHNTRSFSNISFLLEAKVKSWDWALENMKSLNKENVTFASASMELISLANGQPLWDTWCDYWSMLKINPSGIFSLNTQSATGVLSE